MKIGLTYDLRQDYLDLGFSVEDTAEFEAHETVDAIDNALKNLGHETQRIGHIKNLVQKLVAGSRWDLVFNVAEGFYGLARESQVPALLDAYEIPYTFSDPLTLSLCLHKGMTKRILRDSGIPTTPFCVVTSLSEEVNLKYPLFVKPVAEGTSKGIDSLSRVENADQLKYVVTKLLTQYKQGILIEEFLPGREFTVGILGQGDEAYAIGAMEIVFTLQSGDFYRFDCKQSWEVSPIHAFPQDADSASSMTVALQAWRALGCRDAGRVDVRFDAHGIANVIEINPIAGLRPAYSDLPILSDHFDLPFQKLIEKIVYFAQRRQ